MESKNILIMAGGTGGHIFPALAVAKALQKRGHRIVWLGSQNSMEERLLAKHDDIILETLAMKGLRGNGIKRVLEMPIMLGKAIFAAKNIIKNHQIDLVIGFGGFITSPGGLAAYLLRVPMIIHEQNAVVGLSNKLLAKFAKRVLFAFTDAFARAPSQDWVGNPVRQEIALLPTPEQRFLQREGALKITVIGGSLGARIFNQLLPQALALLPENQRPNLIHQTGRGNLESVQQAYEQHHIQAQCVEFIHDMTAVYRDSDLLICRAGALTIAELSAAGLGALLVPFPQAVDDHQTVNARSFVSVQAGLLLPQAQLSADNLAQIIANLTREQCLNWAKQARTLAIPDSAEKVANIAEEVLHT